MYFSNLALLALLALSATSAIAAPKIIEQRDQLTLATFGAPTEADFKIGMTAIINEKEIDTSKFIFYDGDITGVRAALPKFKTDHSLYIIRDVMTKAWEDKAELLHPENAAKFKDINEHEKCTNAFWGNASKAYASLATKHVHMLLEKKSDGSLLSPTKTTDEFLKQESVILKAKAGLKVTAFAVTPGTDTAAATVAETGSDFTL